MQELIVDIMNQFGYVGICFLIAVENIFPPIPSEVILTFGGFMTTYTFLTVPGVVIAATLGSVLGAVVLYGVGMALTSEKFEKILDSRVCKVLGFKKEEVYKSVAWFDRKGQRAVLFGRCIPIVRSLVSIPAGMARMEFSRFFPYTLLGSFAWNVLLVSLGAFLGASWSNVLDFFHMYSKVTLIILAVVFAGVSLMICRKKKMHKE